MTNTPQVNPPALIPNRTEAKRYLQLLDPYMDRFTFFTVDDVIQPDGTKREDETLTATYHGTLDEVWPTLVRANLRGAGIFVLVNRSNMQGRKIESMKGSRAVWAELDQNPTGTPPLVPSLTVITSPGKGHGYWFCDELTQEDHRSVQERLITDYGSDPNAKDFCRVLRLPGTLHMKRQPFSALYGQHRTASQRQALQP